MPRPTTSSRASALPRRCARPACGDAPVATMSFDYAGRLVVVDELGPYRHPASYDLCGRHTATLVPPRGWRVEVTVAVPVVVEAAVPVIEPISHAG